MGGLKIWMIDVASLGGFMALENVFDGEKDGSVRW